MYVCMYVMYALSCLFAYIFGHLVCSHFRLSFVLISVCLLQKSYRLECSTSIPRST